MEVAVNKLFSLPRQKGPLVYKYPTGIMSLGKDIDLEKSTSREVHN